MSLDLIRICWPNAAMPFVLALMPLIAFTQEWQANPAQTAWVQAQEYEISTAPSLTVFEPPANNFPAAPLESI
jgi:hypothetical protein